MKRQVVVSIFALLSIMAATSCRSHRKLPQPQSAPSVETPAAPQPAVPVSAPDRDFVQPTPAPAEVISADIVEADRMARDRGWIQDAFFAFDAFHLDDDAQNALGRSAAWLREHPEFRIRIEGHCDERGTEQYNLALGERRAETAASYLAASGIDRDRIEIVSLGEERPFVESHDEEAWRQNRRAHLILVGRR
jgi:peptidoglycan-associated lipoprotein